MIEGREGKKEIMRLFVGLVLNAFLGFLEDGWMDGWMDGWGLGTRPDRGESEREIPVN